jgi:ribonuclease P protein component
MRQKEASFTKGERLCGLRAISDLFSEGKTLYLPPLKVIYRIVTENNGAAPARILISVPKRHFKKAVDRNLIRRRIREAYRQNKMPLINSLSDSGKRIDLAIIWNDAAMQQYDITERCIKEMVVKLSHLA